MVLRKLCVDSGRGRRKSCWRRGGRPVLEEMAVLELGLGGRRRRCHNSKVGGRGKHRRRSGLGGRRCEHRHLLWWLLLLLWRLRICHNRSGLHRRGRGQRGRVHLNESKGHTRELGKHGQRGGSRWRGPAQLSVTKRWLSFPLSQGKHGLSDQEESQKTG